MAVSEGTKDTVAQAGFMAFMAAAMGPVGIFVAALAVAAERAWNGEGGAPAAQELSRQQVADQRQWLAEDRAFRERLRADRKRWLDDGADPTTEPARPSTAEAAGRWWRRLWARMVVFSDDFKTGWREGWGAAKKARGNGAGWRETARTRPTKPDGAKKPDAPKPDPDSRGESEPDGDKAGDKPGNPPVQGDPAPPNRQENPDVTHPENQCRNCGNPSSGDAYCEQCLIGNVREQWTGTKTNGGTPMASSNGSAPKGESNVSVLREMLRRIGGTMSKVEDGVDALSALADTLARQVREATEHATRTGQVAATQSAMDAANAVVARLKQLAIAASQAAVEAVDQVASARASLKVAESAEDALTSAGGTGDAVATAKAA